jgi:glutamate synthase domain-containing protein 2/glutamate synthase domain-containing protein 1/glutamate synthase domain-containing protein 3
MADTSNGRPMLPLYDPDDIRDACGVGFIASRRGVRSHRLVKTAAECLANVNHRGAVSADGTGDGAGMMLRVPYELLARDLGAAGAMVPDRGKLGVVMTFLPPLEVERARKAVEGAVEAEGLDFLMWRRVPVGPLALSETARSLMPVIEMALVADPGADADEEAFERALFLVRREAERRVAKDDIEGFSVPSSSCRTVVFKGLFVATDIEAFYWDLVDPMFKSDFAIFHQRYSTNTFPSWALAQPFRMVAHNGEINTVRANRSWMAARSQDIKSEVWGDRTEDLNPLVSDGSDSASLDNAFEVLVRSGRGVAHAKEMLIPAAWENVSDLDDQLRAFYEYHAFLTEPWDGPAAIAASDGRTLIGGLDRNGLRPSRWTLTPDYVIMASEAGVAPAEEIEAESAGQLGPGDTMSVDLETGEVRFSDEVKRELAHRSPYADWVRTQTNYVTDAFDDLQDERFDPEALARVFAYTAEERRLILMPMAAGDEPVLSMGHDTGLAALSEFPQRMSRYFHQAFAQVTNPPMDPIRERLVMSLRTYIGARGSLLEETPQQAHLMELSSVVLSDAEVTQISESDDAGYQSTWIPILFDPAGGADGLREGLARIVNEAEAAVRTGSTVLILSDREVSPAEAPIPITLAVGAVHHRLVETGLRLHASIIAVTGESRDAHDVACLIGFGASAVNPYMAIEQVRSLAADGEVTASTIEAQENYRKALEKGILKIMSKMGICTISAYRGSELFEVIGLDDELCDLAFRYAGRRIGGIGFERIAADTITRHSNYTEGDDELGGFYKHRRGGMPHIASPRAVLAVQKAVRSGDPELWQKFVDVVQEDRGPLELRDLLAFKISDHPVPLEEVEPAERIMRRFTTAAMSLGALSKEAHETLAEAMNYIGGLSNSGEGGEDPQRLKTSRNSAIKQIASGRFGVTPGYLASAEEFQIKMAQGSKPGEGGQLPGHKVSEEIARLRHTEPGITLISPPPHHDIYSIEDLAQLIHDLKAFKPLARVSVKLVSGPGVGTIAVGVAKALADVVMISGNSGGTGASPLVSIKHAGSPWELGLAEAHQALTADGLRHTMVVETDGGIRTGKDVLVAALLGADRYGFGTLPLIALGCKMVRQCHENTCPVGIATQDLDLRAKYTGAVEQVVALFTHIAEEVRHLLAAIGARSVEEVIGRGDLLAAKHPDHPLSAEFLTKLARAEVHRDSHGTSRSFRTVARSPVGEQIALEGRRVIHTGARIDLSYPVRNTDRAVGTRLSGEIAEEMGDAGLPDGSINVRLSGVAGQSLGAFLAQGVAMTLVGTGNDYVGKGMGGGSIAILPTVSEPGAVAHGAGNACLYGATGGTLYVAGSVGQRFAVRNSGATAVVEGASDHCCEYMTGGTVVVLGPLGRNVAAGMTGGKAYLWDPAMTSKAHIADSAPEPHRLDGAGADELRTLIKAHVAATKSSLGEELLARWDEAVGEFWVLAPEPPDLKAGAPAVEIWAG